MPKGGNNNQNLRPLPKGSSEVQRKGGIASGETRRKQRAMREVCQFLLSMPLKKGHLDEIEGILDNKGKNLTAQEKMLISMFGRAIAGDVNAFRTIMELSGNKPKDEVEQTVKVIDHSFIDALNDKASEVWEKNGDNEK